MKAFWSFLLFTVSGFFLYGRATIVDQTQTATHYLGAFLIFLAFVISIFCAGRLLARYLARTEPDFIVDLGLGLGFFIVVAQIFGLAGAIGYFPNPWLTAAWFLPVCLFAFLRMEFSFPRWGRLEAVGILLALFPFALTWIPDSMPDPLYYHLTSARWWLDAGRIYFPPTNAGVFVAGSWDALYLWAGYFVGGPEGKGLVEQQLFGQWTHFLLGGIGTACALHCLFAKIFPAITRHSLFWLTAIALLSSSQLSTVYLAKNDWGASFFLLLAVLLLQRPKYLLAGFFLGLALSSKPSMAFIALPLTLVFWPWKWRASAFVGGGLFLGALPYLWRNFSLTGEFFFPLLVGPEYPSFYQVRYYSGEGFSFSGKSFLWQQIANDSLFWVLTVALALVAWWARKRNALAAALAVAVTLGAVFFFCKVGLRAEFRLYGLGCLLLGGLGLGFLLERVAIKPAILAGLFLLASLWAGFPWVGPKLLFEAQSPQQEVQRHFGGQALVWIRANLVPEKVVGAVNDSRIFYLSDRKYARIWDSPPLDRELFAAQDLPGVVAALRRQGVEYLFFSRVDWDVLFSRSVVELLDQGWKQHPETIVFGNSTAKVIDLVRLEAKLRGKSEPHAPNDR